MHTQPLDYSADSVALFARFAHLPYAIFLDSHAAQTQGRYDIITADPHHLLNNTKDIFIQLQTALSTITPLAGKIRQHFPFTIGAIGYLSYDISRALENIPNHAIDDIALPQSVVGIYHWSIVVDHVLKKTTLIALHKNDIKKINILLKKTPKIHARFLLQSDFQSNLSSSTYQNCFYKIKEHILAGDCYQVNFAQRFSAKYTGSPWLAYQALRNHNPAPFSAFMQLAQGAVLCCSPERFLKIIDQQVETKPIKGTMPRFSDSTKDIESQHTLSHSEKDRAENVMIVDLLRNDLSKTCIPGSVQVAKLCAIESFSNVHHLVSTITGTLQYDKTAIDCFKACFPGGSITGAPKIAAQKIIESLEPHRRSVYCGNIFYADIFGSFDSNIAIRTMICDRKNIHCYAGGGIVYDSECEKEYAETWIKVNRLLESIKNLSVSH